MIEDLGNIGDFVSGIAVLATLVYLSIQIRTNTNAINSASRERVASEYRDVLKPQADPLVVRAISNGLRNFPDISFEDKVHFHFQMNDESLFMQAAFASYETGQLEEETYHAYLANYASFVNTPGGKKWFEEVVRPIYTRGLVEAVDRRLLAGGLVDVLSLSVYQFVEEDARLS